MANARVASLSQSLRSCGAERRTGSGSLPEGVTSRVACLSCLFWLESADALLAFLQTCKAWRAAAQQQIREGNLGVVFTFSGVETLTRLSPPQRGAIVKSLARCAEASLFLDFSVASGHTVLHDTAVSTGRQLFAQMTHARDLTIHLEAWQPPLGCFTVELCRLIARSGPHLKSLQLGGARLHQRMRAFLASGWQVQSAVQPTVPETTAASSNSSSNNNNNNNSSSTSSSSRKDSYSGGVHVGLKEAGLEASLSKVEEAAISGGDAKGDETKPLPFVLPELKRLVVQGFQLLEFFEAPQLEEHAVIITDEIAQSSSVSVQVQPSATARRLASAPSVLGARLPSHRFWGQEVPLLHPCLGIRFAAANCAHLRTVEVAGFVPPAIRSGLLSWIRGVVSFEDDPNNATVLRGQSERTDIAAAARSRRCPGCEALQQRQTHISDYCWRLPQVESLRVDDLTLLVFACAPRMQKLEVNVSSSGEWPLLLEYLRVYGAQLKELTVWAEDLLPAWLQRSVHAASVEQSLGSCRVSTETLLLLDFLRLTAAPAGAPGGAPAGAGKQSSRMHRVPSGAPLGKVKLPYLTELTGPTCLLEELSPSSHALPALQCIDTWGDASRLQSFLYQQHNLQSVRVRGLTHAEEWEDEDVGEVAGAGLGGSAPPMPLRSTPSRKSLLTQEAPQLRHFTGPGSLLKATLSCPLLRRLELTVHAEQADAFLLAGGAPQLDVLLYGGHLTLHHQKVADATSALRRLRVLHALVLDTASVAEAWGVCTPEIRGGLGSESASRSQAGEDDLLSTLDGLEQLYVHRLVVVPQAFLQYLAAARCLRLVGLQRCEGISMGAVVSALESRGFRRLRQDHLPNPECRDFACSLSKGGLVERFVVLKRD
ncbi:hypothetical protein Emed_000163 [Eimeria media]